MTAPRTESRPSTPETPLDVPGGAVSPTGLRMRRAAKSPADRPDLLALRNKVGRIVMEHLDQHEPAVGRDAASAVLADFRTAVDEVRAVLDELDQEAAKTASQAGVSTKRCTKCRHWMVVAAHGRPRQYCSADCRSAARAERS